MIFRVLIPIAAVLGGLAGCQEFGPAGSHPAPPLLTSEPIGLQVGRADPRLAGMPFRVLLDFERPTDLAFLASPSREVKCSSDQAHTGAASLRMEHGGDIGVKLGSLLSGGKFPGKWTLAGAYFYTASSDHLPAKVTISYRANAAAPALQRTVTLAAGGWTPVFVDLTSITSSAEAGLLRFEVESSHPVYCDDVVLLDNNRTHEAPAPGAPAESGWTIRQVGFAIIIERPGHFRITLKTPEAAPDGWIIEEADDVRARLVSPSEKTWTIYADGRQYQDGQFSPLGPMGDRAAIFERQHGAPADLIVPEEFGRIDRDTAGDRNNDGYNEVRGSYQLVAKGPRFEVTLKPNTHFLAQPILEISGLPAGNVLATVEGQLIEKTTRLPNGNLLVRVPLTLERATTISITVR
jgi:hypothetical protein